MRRVMLDTDTISYFFRGNSSVLMNMGNYLQEYDFVNISVITYYEVLNGLYYRDAKKQLQRFVQFIKKQKVLPLTKISANIAAKTVADLKKTGKIIDHNDILIASIAIEHDLVLVTNNTGHFSRISDLKLANWT